MSNRRPQTSGARAEAEMKDKAARAMANAKDPVEKLRLFALSRGAKGIMGLGRYLIIHEQKHRFLFNWAIYNEYL